MIDNPSWRHARYVHKPLASKPFETLCQQVFAELYHCPGARLFGRHGQLQSGLDILFHDFRTAPINKGRGMVFVQCKYTEKPSLSIQAITDDVLSASQLIEKEPGYAGVYLFIVATNAQNDQKLHTAMQNLRAEKDLPFEIEVYTWDKLCQTILDNDRLWELFNESPEGRLPIRYRSRAHLLADCIADHCAHKRLEDAQREDQHRRSSQHVPAFQMGQGMRLPDEICFQSPPLRKALLALYSAGVDAHAALPFRQYEFDVDNMQSAQTCLDYLRSERIVGHIRAPGRTFLFVGEAPRFAALLKHLVEVICSAQGSPDCLGALAVMLVMESQDKSVQDRSLEMMQARAMQDEGTRWERESRIAHAVVRFYYVLRRGWNELACRRALGDRVEHGAADKWGAPFNAKQQDRLLIAGRDPLADPAYCGAHARQLILHLGEYTQGEHEQLWPNLLAECTVYSAGDRCEDMQQSWTGGSPWYDSHYRVVDFQTLAIAADNAHHAQLLERFALTATQRTFERLLGYRALLRAHVEQIGDQAGSVSERLRAIERLIGAAKIFPNKLDAYPGTLWISTVYDNVAMRVDELDDCAHYFNHFTLSRDDFTQQHTLMASWTDERWGDVKRQYQRREDDFSLACLLALHHHMPLLTYQQEQAEHARDMGIAATHPNRENGRWLS